MSFGLIFAAVALVSFAVSLLIVTISVKDIDLDEGMDWNDEF